MKITLYMKHFSIGIHQEVPWIFFTFLSCHLLSTWHLKILGDRALGVVCEVWERGRHANMTRRRCSRCSRPRHTSQFERGRQEGGRSRFRRCAFRRASPRGQSSLRSGGRPPCSRRHSGRGRSVVRGSRLRGGGRGRRGRVGR